MEPQADAETGATSDGIPFHPYFPRYALPLLNDRPSPGVRQRQMFAGVLLADIVGFTQLSQRLADRSPEAPEQLRDILNRCFGRLVDIVHGSGGEVSHFAGDAVIALWPASDPAAELRARALRAVACASRVNRELGNVVVTPEFRLQLRLAVSAGPIWLRSIGGVENRWKFVTAGAPLKDVMTAAHRATPGDVRLSPQLRALVGDSVSVNSSGSQPGAAAAAAPDQNATLAAYLPRTLRDLIATGQGDWIGEYRSATTAFLRVWGLDEQSPEALDRTHQLVTILQRAVYRYGGTINQVLAEDDGLTTVAAWGLSRHSHEDDAARAVRSGLLARKELIESGFACRVGIATGRIFVGTRGNAARLDYGLIGESVNLAARLVESTDAILCDAPTRNAARREIVFESLPPVPLRGRPSPTAVFRPLRERTSRQKTPGIVGRLPERERLAAALAALEHGRRGSVIAVEGQAGIGKSALARELIARTQSSIVRGMVANGSALERATPFYAWRAVFSRLLDLQPDGAPDPAGPAPDPAQSLLRAMPLDLRSRAALLHDVLGLDLPGDDKLGQMSPASRADATRVLAAELLRHYARQSPLLIVVEDAQWLDSASWGLIDAVRTGGWPILLLVLSRPMPEEEVPAEQRSLLHDPATVRLRLDPLRPEEALAVACQRLQVEELPEELARLIHEKAEGHPLFVEELVSSLVDRDLIAVRGGDCLVVGAAQVLSAAAVSNTVEGIIISRIDQLTATQQLTLKVASVLGRRFWLGDLAAVHPLGLDPDDIRRQLTGMQNLELVREAAGPGEYLFHHATIEEVAYELLPLAQRRELHATTARWYERSPAPPDSRRSFAVLAHHWLRAGAVGPALDALEPAGEQALRAGAFPEAVFFFRQALDVAARAPDGAVPSVRLARWERQLSRAYFGLGDGAECRRYAESSVSRLGFRVLERPLGLALAILRQLLSWLVNIGLGWSRPRSLPDPNRQQVTRAFHALSYAYYLDQQRAPLLFAVLTTVNTAEKGAPTGELARGYAALAYIAGAHGLSRIARRLHARALSVAGALDNSLVRCDVLYISALSRISNGQWTELQAEMADARAEFQRLGEVRSVLDVQLLESYVAYNTGNLREAARAYADLGTAAARVGASRNEYLAVTWQAGTALRRGRLDECLGAIRTAAALPRERGAELSLLGFSALAHLRSDDPVAARRIADQARALIASHVYTAPYSFEGYRDVADVYLTLWERAGAGRREAAVDRRSALDVCQALRQFSRGCALARPSALWIRGRCLILLGRRRAAIRGLSRGLELALQVGLPFEEALLRRELARISRDPALRRSQYLAASALVQRIGALSDTWRMEER